MTLFPPYIDYNKDFRLILIINVPKCLPLYRIVNGIVFFPYRPSPNYLKNFGRGSPDNALYQIWKLWTL